jgi:tetratricopeptide (TPR) repeat protein
MAKVALWAGLIAASIACAQEPIQKAETAFRSGDIKRAATLAQDVLAGNPNSVEAHMLLGIIGSQNAAWVSAVENFESVIRLTPSSPQGYFYLGQAYLYQQKWEQAAKQFVLALDRNYPDRERISVELAFAENEAGQPQKALQTLNSIPPPRAGPLAAQFYAVSAFAQGTLHQPSLAVEAMQRAVEIDGFNPQYWEFVISTRLNMSQPNVAVADAINAQKLFPDEQEIQYLFGLAGYYMNDPSLVRIALRNLGDANPGSPVEVILRGMVHRLEGNGDQAMQEFVEASRRGVKDAHVLLALVLKEKGDLTGAERELRDAERFSPGNGQVEFELGKILLGRGENVQAIAYLQKAAQYMPSNAAVQYELARLYGRLGNKQKSDECLRKFKQLRQTDPTASGPPQ